MGGRVNLYTMKTAIAPILHFMIAGFSKCGTTTFCALINKHPDIYLPEIKETNFFLYADYMQRWPELQAHFRSLRNETVVGEGTTMYSAHEHEKDACDRILASYPDIKFIFIARDPIKRIESSYREFHHSGINFAIDAPYGIGNALEELPALLEDSKYWERINTYRKCVPDDRILVVFFEDLIEDHISVLERCFDFLGVSSVDKDKFSMEKRNTGKEKLYDSRLLRWLRLHAFTGYKIAKLSSDQQNYYFSKIGLRKRFTTPLKWDRASIVRVKEELGYDAEQFLLYYGKPKEFWEVSRK